MWYSTRILIVLVLPVRLSGKEIILTDSIIFDVLEDDKVLVIEVADELVLVVLLVVVTVVVVDVVVMVVVDVRVVVVEVVEVAVVDVVMMSCTSKPICSVFAKLKRTTGKSRGTMCTDNL